MDSHQMMWIRLLWRYLLEDGSQIDALALEVEVPDHIDYYSRPEDYREERVCIGRRRTDRRSGHRIVEGDAHCYHRQEPEDRDQPLSAHQPVGEVLSPDREDYGRDADDDPYDRPDRRRVEELSDVAGVGREVHEQRCHYQCQDGRLDRYVEARVDVREGRREYPVEREREDVPRCTQHETTPPPGEEDQEPELYEGGQVWTADHGGH